MVLVNGPTSDIFILVTWPSRSSAAFPFGGSIKLRRWSLGMISSGGDGVSHNYLYCSILLDIFSFGSSEVSQCPPPCPSQLLDPSFKKLRYFQFQKSPIAMDRARSLYRGREISRRLIQSVFLDVCGVPEVAAGGQFPELLQPELCCRNYCIRNCWRSYLPGLSPYRLRE